MILRECKKVKDPFHTDEVTCHQTLDINLKSDLWETDNLGQINNLVVFLTLPVKSD